MFVATVDRNSIHVQGEELITSGSVKTNFVQFKFSDDWNGLTKTAIFQTKKVSIPVIVDGEDKVAIPWEAMAFPKEEIKFGVYGVRFDDKETEDIDEEIVLPTIWGSLGKVVEGVLVESPPITAPTKDSYQQLLEYIKSIQPGGGGSGTDERLSDGTVFVYSMNEEPNKTKPYTVPLNSFAGIKPTAETSYKGVVISQGKSYIVEVGIESVDETAETASVTFLSVWDLSNGGMPYLDQLVAPHNTYSEHDVETLLDKSLYYSSWSDSRIKIYGELEIGKEFSAYFLYDGEQLNPTLNYYGVFVCDEYDTDRTDRVKATLKNATFVGNRTESLNSFLTFFKLDELPQSNAEVRVPFKSAIGLMPQWMNTPHRGLMTVGNSLYLIDFRLNWLDHDTEEFVITIADVYPISKPGPNGVSFIPSVSEEGVISFVNDGGLPNPDPVNIKGPIGATGEDALVYSGFLIFDNVTGDPAPVDIYSFADDGHSFNRPPKLNETWTGVIIYYSDAESKVTKDVFVSTFKIVGDSEGMYNSLLIGKTPVMPIISSEGSESNGDSFITIKDKTISTPTDLKTVLGRDSSYIGCVRMINSRIGESTFENDIIWISFTAVLDTYYLTIITIDGYVEQAQATGSGPFATTNKTKFIREDQLDLAKGTYFLGSWTEAPAVNSEYTVDISSFVGRKPVVSNQYIGTIRHDSANTLYDVSLNIVNIVNTTVTVKVVRAISYSNKGGETTLTAGDGLTIADGVASVDTPVRNILTQAEFNALPESEQNNGVYFISGERDGGSSGGSSIRMPLVTLLANGWDENGIQTITVQGILAEESAQIIRLTPTIVSQELYYSSGILCTNQAENSLTFAASDIPASDISVYVEIQEVS